MLLILKISQEKYNEGCESIACSTSTFLATAEALTISEA
jgi:hypothetical protein